MHSLSSLSVGVICFSLLLLIGGCVYEPEGEYYKEIEPPSPVAEIDLNDYNTSDTIVLAKPTDFTFRVGISSPSQVTLVSVVLDSVEIYNGTANSGSFHLSQFAIRPGTHELMVQFIARSNSGSLADKVEGENFKIWRQWSLKVLPYDENPPGERLVNIEARNGFLLVSWKPYTNSNFVNYKLEARGKTYLFTDSLQASWTDSLYLYGYMEYRLTVTNRWGSTSVTGRIDEKQEAQIDYSSVDSTVLFQWKSSKFYGALGSVTLLENTKVYETILESGDTTRRIKLTEVLWGRTGTVTIRIMPRKGSEVAYEKYTFLPRPNVNALRNAPDLYYQQELDKFVGYSNHSGYLYYYTRHMQPIDSFRIACSAISVPSQGNYLYYIYNNQVVRFDVRNASKTYYSEYTNFSIEPYISGAANGLVSIYAYNKRDPFDNRLAQTIKDTQTGSDIVRKEEYYDPKMHVGPSKPVLSDDGQYVYRYQSWGALYSTVNGIQEIGIPLAVGWFFSFRSDQPNQLFLTSTSSFFIVRASDLAVINQVNIPTGYSPASYDPVSHYIVCEKDDASTVYLVNVDTGDTRTFPAYSRGHRLLGGYLINNTGEFIKVL